MASADIGNYQNRRFEGMINLPIVDDRLDIRVAGEWTKRQGYSFNQETDDRIDGRDLWSGRVTLGLKPVENLRGKSRLGTFFRRRRPHQKFQATLQNGPRSRRSGWCAETRGAVTLRRNGSRGLFGTRMLADIALFAGRISSTSRLHVAIRSRPVGRRAWQRYERPYASETQSRNLHVIDPGLNPEYKRRRTIRSNSNAEYDVTPSLKVTYVPNRL